MDEIDTRKQRIIDSQIALAELAKIERRDEQQQAEYDRLIALVKSDTQFLAGAQAMLDRMQVGGVALQAEPPVAALRNAMENELQICHDKIAKERIEAMLKDETPPADSETTAKAQKLVTMIEEVEASDSLAKNSTNGDEDLGVSNGGV